MTPADLDRKVLDRAIRLQRGALDVTKETLTSKTTDPRMWVVAEAVQRLCDAGRLTQMQTTGDTRSTRYRVTERGTVPVFKTRRKAT